MDPEDLPPAAPPTPEPEEPSLEDAIGAALDRMESGEGEPAEPDDSGPVRDEHGRFAKRELGSENSEPPVAPLEFPEHWSEDRRSLIGALPPEHRERVFSQWRDLENEHVNRQRELADQRKGIEPLLAVLEPLRPQMAMQGIAPEVALQSFLAGMQRLRTDPQQGLYELAEQVGRPLAGSASARDLIRRLSSALGVDALGASPDQAASAEEIEWLDPRAAREVTALRSQLSGLQQQLATFTQQQQLSAQQQAAQQAQAFSEAKAADGTPLRPHFAAVRQEMARLIGAGVAQDLETAYERAIWSNPQIRQQLVEAERKAVAEKAEADRKAAVAKAKAATAAPGGHSRPGATRPADDLTLEDAIGQAYDRIAARDAA